MTQFVVVDDTTGRILRGEGFRDMPDMAGPPQETPEPRDGTTYFPWQDRLVFSGPTPTSHLCWVGGAPQWVEAAALDELKTAAIAKTYADVDKVHFDAVGNRATEYQEAEAAARAFAAGGFQGEADDDVHSYAIDNTTGEVQTDQWAAENIIARADAFRAAQKAMRNTRFKRQAEMRAAATPEELTAVVAAWDGFIAGLRAQLGL